MFSIGFKRVICCALLFLLVWLNIMPKPISGTYETEIAGPGWPFAIIEHALVGSDTRDMAIEGYWVALPSVFKRQDIIFPALLLDVALICAAVIFARRLSFPEGIIPELRKIKDKISFRFSTLIVMMLVAGLILWLNLHAWIDDPEKAMLKNLLLPLDRATKYGLNNVYGWPIGLDYEIVNAEKAHLVIDPLKIVFNAFIGLLIIIASGILIEFSRNSMVQIFGNRVIRK